MEPEIETDAAIPFEPAIPGGVPGGGEDGGGEASGNVQGGVAESDGAGVARIEIRRRYADAIVEACRQRMLLQVDLLNQKYR
jgi:hypothetical protein